MKTGVMESLTYVLAVRLMLDGARCCNDYEIESDTNRKARPQCLVANRITKRCRSKTSFHFLQSVLGRSYGRRPVSVGRCDTRRWPNSLLTFIVGGRHVFREKRDFGTGGFRYRQRHLEVRRIERCAAEEDFESEVRKSASLEAQCLCKPHVDDMLVSVGQNMR